MPWQRRTGLPMEILFLAVFFPDFSRRKSKRNRPGARGTGESEAGLASLPNGFSIPVVVIFWVVLELFSIPRVRPGAELLAPAGHRRAEPQRAAERGQRSRLVDGENQEHFSQRTMGGIRLGHTTGKRFNDEVALIDPK